jgi:hypothetical protein
MITSVGMIESEMGYHVANPFTTHNLSIILFYFILMKLLQLKALFKKGGRSEAFKPGYYTDLDHKIWISSTRGKTGVTFSSCFLKLF